MVFILRSILFLFLFSSPCFVLNARAQGLLGSKLESSDEKIDTAYFPMGLRYASVFRVQPMSKNRQIRALAKINDSFKDFFQKGGKTEQRFGVPIRDIEQIAWVAGVSPKEIDFGQKGNEEYHRFFRFTLLKVSPKVVKQVTERSVEIKKIGEYTSYKVYQVDANKKKSNNFSQLTFLSDRHVLVTRNLDYLPMAQKICLKQPRKSVCIETIKQYSEFHAVEVNAFKGDAQLSGWREIHFLVRDLSRLLRSDLRQAICKGCGIQFGKSLKLKATFKFPKKKDAFSFAEKLSVMIERGKGIAKRFGISSDKTVRSYATAAQASLDSAKVTVKRATTNLTANLKIDKNLFRNIKRDYQIEAENQVAHNRMRSIGLCLQMHHDAYTHFPKAFSTGPNGHRHSWRIHVLQFSDYKHIYDQYRFDEAWDSPHNKKLTKEVPDMFLHPSEDSAAGFSSFQVVTGVGTAFEAPELLGDKKPTRMRDFLDGTSNTIVAVEVKTERHWADPTPFTLEEALKENRLGGFNKGVIRVAFADGSTASLSSNLEKETFSKLFSKDGGEVINHDGLLQSTLDLHQLLQENQ